MNSFCTEINNNEHIQSTDGNRSGKLNCETHRPCRLEFIQLMLEQISKYLV